MLEELDTFVRDCERLLGVSLEVGHLNTSPVAATRRREEVTPQVADRIAALCEPNRRVYEAVRARIAEQGSWLS